MGRVFDFNMSRLCPAGSCAAVRQSRRPRAAIAECAGFRWAIPDKRYTLHCLHLYVTSQFGHGLRFFRIPRYASRDRRGIPGARRSPYTYDHDYDLPLPVSGPRGGDPRPRAHTPLIL
jgi:hypothetical protein